MFEIFEKYKPNFKYKKYGYGRVSSKDQNEARQYEQFIKEEIEEDRIFIDKASGKDFNRNEYKVLKRILKDSTEHCLLHITSIDRLGRNYTEILNEWRELTKDYGIDIKVLDMPLLDTTICKGLLGNFIADLVLQILAFVAEQERLKIKRNQAEGIALAKAQGKYKGRKAIPKPTNWNEIYAKWKNREITGRKAMSLCLPTPLNPNIFYKFVNEEKLKNEKN